VTTIILHQPMTFHTEDGPGAGNPIADILRGRSAFDVVSRTDSMFTVEGTAKSGYEGWTLVLTSEDSTTFTYQDGVPANGIATVQIFSPDGDLALEITTEIYFNSFGDWSTPGFLSGYQDVIQGSAGDDDLSAGDSYFGQTINGRAGADTLSGSGYNDRLDGGTGDDVVSSTGSDASLDGGAGNDIITLHGTGRAFGGRGNDLIVAESYDTFLDGGLGNDTLVGGEYGARFRVGDGRDRVEGATWYDFIQVTAPASGVYQRTEIAGGGGGDRVAFDDGAPAVSVYMDMKAPGAVFALTGVTYVELGDGGGVVHMGGDMARAVQGGEGDDSLYGGAGSDTLTGLAGRDWIEGGAGNDYIQAGDQGVLAGGDGDDNISVHGGQLAVNGGSGSDQLGVNLPSGAEGAFIDLSVTGWQDTGIGLMKIQKVENLNGTNAADHFIGNSDANTLYGAYGQDTLEGGEGGDTLYAYGSGAQLFGGDGADFLYLDVGAHTEGVFENVIGGAGDDYLIVSGDYVRANARGGAGSDILSLHGSYGDILDFDAASGAVAYGTARVTFAAVERFQVYGGALADTIVGASGADTLAGADGDDSLSGGAGDDILRPGRGTNILDGGAGLDVADFTGSSSSYWLVLDLRITDPQQAIPGQFNTFVSIEGLFGGNGNDSLTGDDQANRLGGGFGADSLVGNEGADTLTGGIGADTLTGGGGSDTFGFDNPSVGYLDLIVDLEAADVIDLSLIDADSVLEGDQAFALVDAFTGLAGELQLRPLTGLGHTLLEGDLDGDGVADFRVQIEGLHGGFDNFVL
jgi:Ca2+-binding RTX toxin-like protein